MAKKLIKTDRNGSKHYEGWMPCDRCGGSGIYCWGAIINGSPQYAGTCFKCNGSGKMYGKWIERTPEYQAKLDAKREAHWKAQQEQINAERAKREAEREAKRLALEAERKARKAISQHVGVVGERLNLPVTYIYSGSWERKLFSDFDKITMYAHLFRTAEGNVLVWKTQKSMPCEKGISVILRGSVKEHTEYDGEKQTIMTRCRITEMSGKE